MYRRLNHPFIQLLLLAGLMICLADAPGYAQCATQQTHKLLQVVGSAGDQFGSSVSLSGSTAVIGSPTDDFTIGLPDAGSASIYHALNGVWTLEAQFTAPIGDAAANEYLGFAVAAFGSIIVVGSYGDDNAGGANAGAAYPLLRLSDFNWTPHGKMTASDGAAEDKFGYSVAVFLDTAVVGAPYDDFGINTDAGSAYVFYRNGSTWNEVAKLTASDAAPGDHFGTSVAIWNDTIIVGSPQDDAGAGSAYVYRNSSGVWNQEAKLTASDASPNADMGSAVTIELDRCVIGAPRSDTLVVSDSGAAYVYSRLGSIWTEQAKLTALDAATGDYFGRTISTHFNSIVVGSPFDDHAGGVDSGSAYVFIPIAGVWTQQGKMTALDAGPFKLFGNSVSAFAHSALIGSSSDSEIGGLAGAAFAFDMGCDSDFDSLYNAVDNCPTASNLDQTDTDTDGMGDACDPCSINPSATDCNANLVQDSCDLTGGALQFSGAHYVQAPLNVSETSYTVSLWFKTTNANGGLFSVDVGTLGSGGHDRHIFLSNGDLKTRVYNMESITTTGINFADGLWHQVVHIYGGAVGGQRLYVDGQLRATGTKAFSDFNWQDGINIGYSNDSTSPYFNGQIDDVRIWSTALSPAEITTNAMFGVAPPAQAGLQAWYRFDELAGMQYVVDAATSDGQLHGWLGQTTAAGGDDPMRIAADFDLVDCNGNIVPDTCEPDSDSDGVVDACDNCPAVTNGSQVNSDGDSLGDVCDPDDDNDGVPDVNDNCVLVANPGQEDADGNGVGDTCSTDDDNDGVLDANDACPMNKPGLAVTSDGRPRGDTNGDCLLDGLDISTMITEALSQ